MDAGTVATAGNGSGLFVLTNGRHLIFNLCIRYGHDW
jgi:hypothetical protein